MKLFRKIFNRYCSLILIKEIKESLLIYNLDFYFKIKKGYINVRYNFRDLSKKLKCDIPLVDLKEEYSLVHLINFEKLIKELKINIEGTVNK